MATTGGDNSALLAAGLLGLGVLVGAAVLSGSADRRAIFTQRLREQLQLRNIELLAANLGRDAQRAIWVLTLRLPNQHVLTLHAPVDPKHDPLAPELAFDVAARAIAFVTHRQLIAT
jgi:hypothetical protein